MSRLLIAALAASSFATSPLAAQTAESYDLVIANGRVLDGTGQSVRSRRRGDPRR